MGKKTFNSEKLLKELKQLRDMQPDDAVEVVRGYHCMIRKELSDCMESINKIIELSPATESLTKTAIVIAESDFLSEDESDGLNHLFLLGNEDDLFNLFKNIMKQTPKLFERLAEDAGYKK